MEKNKNLNSFRSSISGFSLIEVLVSIGVLAIVMTGTMSYMSNQQKETKALAENLDRQDLKYVMESLMSDGSICSFEIEDSLGDPIINASTLKTAPPKFSLPQIHRSMTGTGTFIEAGKAYNDNPNFKIASIELSNFQDVANNPDMFMADFVVNLDQAYLVRPLKPVRVSALLLSDSTTPTTSKKIIGCIGGGNSQNVIAAAKAAAATSASLVCPPPAPLLALPTTINVGPADCKTYTSGSPGGCPAATPYITGCSLTDLGSKGSFTVKYHRDVTAGLNNFYLQEGTNCSKGGFTGQIYCSAKNPGTPLNATNCPVKLGKGLASTTYTAN